MFPEGEFTQIPLASPASSRRLAPWGIEPSVGVTPLSSAFAVALCVEVVGEELWEASLCALPCVPFALAEAEGEFDAFPPPVWAVQAARVRLNRPMNATADTLLMGARMTGPPTALCGRVGRKYIYLLCVKMNLYPK